MFEDIFSKRIRTDDFASGTVEHISKTYRSPGSGFSKQMVLQFWSVMFSLLSMASKVVLHHGVGNLYANFSTRLVSLAFELCN